MMMASDGEENTPLLNQGGGNVGAFGHGHGHDTVDDDAKDDHRKSALSGYVVILTAFAALGGMLFGYDTGVVSKVERANVYYERSE